MARPAAPLPEITYSQWLKTGYPELTLTFSQLCKWLEPPISVQRVYALRDKEVIVCSKDNKFSTNHPENKAWLIAREGHEPPKTSPGRPPIVGPKPPPPPPRPAPEWGDIPPRKVHQNEETPDADVLSLDLEIILDAIAKSDLSVFRKADIDKIAKLETAARTRVQREEKRGQLIDRRLVSTVLNKLYQVDSDQIKPLGKKLAADLAALFGMEDGESLLKVEQMVDEETNRILKHTKQIMNEFLAGVGADEVDEREAVCIDQILEDTANMMRGMVLDPAVPAHAKDALAVRIGLLEAML